MVRTVLVVASFATILYVCQTVSANAEDVEEPGNSLIRLVRAATKKQQQQEQDCKYEKEQWEECDPSTGLQRRALKLKEARSSSAQCEPTKYITRPCKKAACKYIKGSWTDCSQGVRTRVDQLRTPGAGCEETRTVSRKCKTACRYTKSDWSACENGTKTKILTLTEGDSASCEASKTISKQCVEQSKQRPKAVGKRGRKKPISNVDEA